VKRILLTLSFGIVFLVSFPTAFFAQPALDKHYDVVVAGAGTGGVSAAIQAARMGARVALLEESDWIGGQLAAGVGTMDEGVGPNGTPPSGIYAEFLKRASAYYSSRGKSISTCYWSANLQHCVTPIAAREILMDMIDEVNAKGAQGSRGHIDLYLQDRVTRVLAKDDVVTGVVTSQNQQWSSSILIDATEYGDVIPLTPARYRMGHSVNADGEPSCIQAITWVAEIKKYPQGMPKGFVLQDPPSGYEKWKPNFETSMRIDGNPADRKLPVSFAEYVGYRGLPDTANPANYNGAEIGKITRSAMNWFNDLDVTTDLFDRTKRQRILCEAKRKTLANIYYFQHEMGETQWSVANDEGFDTSYNKMNSCPDIPAEYKAVEENLPQIPYVRESIRIVGEYTLTGGDIRRERNWSMSVKGFTDAIAVGDYADDLHSCNSKPEFFEQDLEHITDLPPGFRFGPFQVPLRSLIPEKVDGLLAAEKNISQSRLANGATRLQPITMLTGQAAGALAALAISEHKQPRYVDPQQVQLTLLASGVILSRQHLSLTIGSKVWQAVEFALVNGWIGDEENIDFDPHKTVTRSIGARILAKAFLSNNSHSLSVADITHKFDMAPNTVKQIYPDVPLYSADFNAVTALHNEGAIVPCVQKNKNFCPDDPLTPGEFLQSVTRLMRKKKWDSGTEKPMLVNSTPDRGRQQLTIEDAAVILCNAARVKASRN